MAGSGMITDQKSIQTCSLSGLATMRGKEVELLQIRAAMIANSKEADAATDYADLMRTALFGLQLTKAACDAVLGIVGALAEGPAKGIAQGYSIASPLAEAGGKFIAGAPAGDSLRKGFDAAAKVGLKNSKLDSGIRDVVELKKIQSDIVVDAVTSDYQRLRADLYAYGEKLAKMTAEAVKNKTVGKVLDVGKTLYKAATAYMSAYDEYKDNDMSRAMDGAKKTFRTYQASIERRLIVLQHEISECEGALVKQGALKIDAFTSSAADSLRNFRPSFPTIGPAR